MNNQHSILDLSWQMEEHDMHEHLNLEQRKHQQKEMVSKIYRQKMHELESKLVSGSTKHPDHKLLDE